MQMPYKYRSSYLERNYIPARVHEQRNAFLEVGPRNYKFSQLYELLNMEQGI